MYEQSDIAQFKLSSHSLSNACKWLLVADQKKITLLANVSIGSMCAKGFAEGIRHERMFAKVNNFSVKKIVAKRYGLTWCFSFTVPVLGFANSIFSSCGKEF